MSDDSDDVSPELIAKVIASLRTQKGKSQVRNGHMTILELYDQWLPTLAHEIDHGAVIGRRHIAESCRRFLIMPICQLPGEKSQAVSFGSVPLAKVDGQMIELWHQGLLKYVSPLRKRPLANGSLLNVRMCVSGALSWHVRAQKTIDANPFAGIPQWVKATEIQKRQGSFTADQLKAFMSHLPPAIVAMWLLAARTGLRKNEFRILRKSQVSLETRMMRVVGKGRKTRDVPIPLEFVSMLAGWMAVSEGEFVFADLSRNGVRPITEHQLRGAIERARKLSGIVLTGNEPPTNHHLRHTFILDMIEKGLPTSFVAALVGHTSSATIDSTYGRLRGETSMKLVRSAMESPSERSIVSAAPRVYRCPDCDVEHASGEALKACIRSHDGNIVEGPKAPPDAN